MTNEESPPINEPKGRCSAPILMNFLKKCRGLVDAAAVRSQLTDDLRSFVYYVPANHIDLSQPPQAIDLVEVSNAHENEVESNDMTPESMRPSPDPPLVSSLGKRKLEKLNGDISYSEARKGFLDPKTGERMYYIEHFVEYNPSKGYLIHWKGYNESDRTWQKADDIPSSYAKYMKLAREEYESNREADKRWEHRWRQSA